MRVSVLAVAVTIGLVLALWPGRAAAQEDFVFTDDEGHLVLRFVGTDASGLTPNQFEEIANLEMSVMVHDRLRADTFFDGEPVDAAWARPMETQLAEHVRQAGPEFSDVHAECRSASCRLVLQHAITWSVEAHRALLGTAQRVIQSFIDAHPGSFEPSFMIAAQYQEPERPYMKVYLRRATGQNQAAHSPR